MRDGTGIPQSAIVTPLSKELLTSEWMSPLVDGVYTICYWMKRVKKICLWMQSQVFKIYSDFSSAHHY